MIAVMGLGFVGLTTALGFSKKGFKVYGYDIDDKKVDKISRGFIPFYEEKLNEVLVENLGNNFNVCCDLKFVVKNCKYIFLCVGTPCDERGYADITPLLKSIKSTLQYIDKKDEKILVIKSTIPPSTTLERIIPFIEGLGFKVGYEIEVVNNPEFLREGSAWNDFINPDRIVIGQLDDSVGAQLEEIYGCFNTPIVRVSLNTAEYIKYLSNTLLATLISYSNEMSIIANEIGNIDIKRAFKVLAMDKRWDGNPAQMSTYVFPGCGFGGYCLPKDTKAIHSLAKEKGIQAEILKSVLKTNKKIKLFVTDKIVSKVDKNETIAILGLAFKPNSDDVRESPASDIIRYLLEKGYENIIAYDPMANTNFEEKYKLPIEYVNSLNKVYERANNLVILTAWDEFKSIEKTDSNRVFDFRYML